MYTYFCMKCYRNFKLELLDNETGNVANEQSRPNTCPYCRRDKLIMVKRTE